LVHRLSCVDGRVLTPEEFGRADARRNGTAVPPTPTSRVERAVRTLYRVTGWNDAPGYSPYDETATAGSDQ
jgi:hypothetical protein